MAPKLHPPVLSVKIHQNHKRLKINSKIVASFFTPLKAHSKDPIHHANHHELTINSPHKTPPFSTTPLKNTLKDYKTTTRSISELFPSTAPQPITHPAARTADKDPEEKPLASNRKTAASLHESIYP
jgi:hypothetical protein